MFSKVSTRVWSAIALVLFLLAFSVPKICDDLAAYCIKPDNTGLYAEVNSWLSRGEAPRQHEVLLYDTIDIGWDRYTLAQLDGQLSILRLRKGITGNYKLDSFSSGTAAFRDEVVFYDPPFSKKSAYFYLLGGYNPDGRIAGISIILGGNGYNIPVRSGEQFFFTQTLVQVDSTDVYPDPGSIRFYDASGNDITDDTPHTIH
jgi:hypothetical protein